MMGMSGQGWSASSSSSADSGDIDGGYSSIGGAINFAEKKDWKMTAIIGAVVIVGVVMFSRNKRGR